MFYIYKKTGIWFFVLVDKKNTFRTTWTRFLYCNVDLLRRQAHSGITFNNLSVLKVCSLWAFDKMKNNPSTLRYIRWFLFFKNSNQCWGQDISIVLSVNTNKHGFKLFKNLYIQLYELYFFPYGWVLFFLCTWGSTQYVQYIEYINKHFEKD